MNATALIVTYNSAAEIAECIAAVKRFGVAVLVVDNASQDSSAELARQTGARVLANPRNLGFAAAVNQGTTDIQTPFVLLLNPDAILETPIGPLLRAVEDSRVGAAGGCLTDKDGRAQRGFTIRRFPTPLALAFECLLINRLLPGNPVNRRYRCLDADLGTPQHVDQPAGAFLLFRREAWQRIGGFDERFSPIWFEDVDFCKRLREAGLEIRYEPAAKARHAGAHSISLLPSAARIRYWYSSLLRYSAKHFSASGHLMCCVAVAGGSVLRAVVGGPRYWTWPVLAAYAASFRLAVRGLRRSSCAPAA